MVDRVEEDGYIASLDADAAGLDVDAGGLDVDAATLNDVTALDFDVSWRDDSVTGVEGRGGASRLALPKGRSRANSESSTVVFAAGNGGVEAAGRAVELCEL